MKSMYNYTIDPNDGLCEVRTGVALEFVTSDINKINTLEELNAAATAAREDANKEKKTVSSASPKKKKVSFRDPLVKDGRVLNVEDEGGVIMVRSRSGMSWKNKINVCGWRTCEKTNEIIILVKNCSEKNFELRAGDRFAQLIVHAKGNRSSNSIDTIMTKGPAMGVADYNGLGHMPVFYTTEKVKIPPGESRLANTKNVMRMIGSDAVYMQLQNLPEVASNMLYADIHAGVIDADYRGDVGVVIYNDGKDEIIIPVGQAVAMGMIYSICCPIVKIHEVLCPVEVTHGNKGVSVVASDVFFTLGDRLKMLVADDIYQEDKMLFHIIKKSEEEDLDIEKGARYTVKTGVCLKTEELKNKGLVCHLRPTYDDIKHDSGVRSWWVDKTTSEINLSMKRNGKDYTKGDVLAEVLLLGRGTVDGKGPSMVSNESEEEEGDATGRGDRGFGSTGM